MKTKVVFVSVLTVVFALAAMPAWATSMPLVPGVFDAEDGVFRGGMQNPNDGGSLLAAAAWFEVENDILNVYLQNVSEEPVSINSDLLHGVFFSAGDAEFSVGSAWAPHGLLDRDGDGNRDRVQGPINVGNAFGYKEGLDMSWVVNGGEADRGIAGVAYDFGPVDPPDFGGAEVFDETGEGNFPPPRRPLAYGIVPGLGEDKYWGDARDIDEGSPRLPVVWDRVHFQLTGAQGFDVDEIGNVSFAYGTDLEIIPEPATMTLLGLGLAGLGARRFMKRRNKT